MWKLLHGMYDNQDDLLGFSLLGGTCSHNRRVFALPLLFELELS